MTLRLKIMGVTISLLLVSGLATIGAIKGSDFEAVYSGPLIR